MTYETLSSDVLQSDSSLPIFYFYRQCFQLAGLGTQKIATQATKKYMNSTDIGLQL